MVTPVQKSQEKKIGSEVNMEKFGKSRRQRNTFTTAVKSNLSVHANLEGDGHGRYTYTGSQIPASLSQPDAARALANPTVINRVSCIPLSSNRYSVLEYTDSIVDVDKTDLLNTQTPILQESSTAVQTEISRPSVRDIVRRFEAANHGQKSEESV